MLFKARISEQDRNSESCGRTDFFALVGPGTAFTEFAWRKHFGTLDDRDDIITMIEPDAILLVECKKEIHWIEPGDIELEEIIDSKSLKGLGDLTGNFSGCFAVCFVDGTVWFLKKSVPKSELLKFMTVDAAMKYDREEVLGNYVLQELRPNYWKREQRE